MDQTCSKCSFFVGVDPSYNGTAVMVLDENANIVEKLLYKSVGESVEERLWAINKALSFIPKIVGLKKVYLEGPSYSSNGAFQLQMGALHFMIRMMFYKKKVKYEVIAPGSLKKFVAGSGSAKKEHMLLNVYKKWGLDFLDNNLADAYGLARMAYEDFKK
jgi:crossover junction endodeoxyribonuclease RuvC